MVGTISGLANQVVGLVAPAAPTAAPSPAPSAAPLWLASFSGGGSAAAAGLAPPRELGDLEALFAEIALSLEKTRASAQAQGQISHSEGARTDSLGLTSLAATISGLVDKIGKETGNIKHQKQVIAELKPLEAAAAAKVAKLEAKEASLLDDIAAREAQIATLQAAETPDTAEIARLQALNTADSATLTGVRADLADARSELKAIQIKIAAAESSVAKSEKEVKRLEAAIQQIQLLALLGLTAAFDLASDNQLELAGRVSEPPRVFEETLDDTAEEVNDLGGEIDRRRLLRETLIQGGASEGAAGRVAGLASGLAGGAGLLLSALEGLIGDAALLAAGASPGGGQRVRMAL